MCKSILDEKRNGIIISTIEASLAVRETIENKGGKLLITKVGSRNIAEMITSTNAVFGGEPCGEYIFPQEVLCPDGILSSLKFIELFCKRGKLSKLKREIKSYPIERAKFKCDNKYKSMEKVREEIKSSFKGKVNEEDGIRIDFDDGWILVRASGTEPAIRLTAEHKNKVKLKAIYAKAAKIIKEGIE
jgi:phosphoglucosamine mutase